MNISAKSVKDWGDALKLPLIFGSIAFIAWRLFRKKEDFSYQSVDVGSLPSTGWGVVSFSDDSIRSDAQSLYTAMESVGTDNDEVERIRLKYVGNRTALAKLWNAFGVRPYGTFGSPMWPLKGTPRNLREWCKAELPSEVYLLWSDMFRLIGK